MSTTNRSKIRCGVIGCGQIAYDKVMPALGMARNMELVALSDPDTTRLERAQAAYPKAKSYSQMEDLLADESVQAVYIATPNFLHASQTVAAASAGKHVLVEKPMAINAEEGREMVEAADGAGVKLMVAYMTLFNPAYKMAKHVVDSGMLGEIVSVRGRHSYVIHPDNISSAAAWRLDPITAAGRSWMWRSTRSSRSGTSPGCGLGTSSPPALPADYTIRQSSTPCCSPYFCRTAPPES